MAPHASVIYERELSEDSAFLAKLDPTMRQVANDLTSWVNSARAVTNRSSLFNRAAYASPDNPYDQMRTARRAVSSDDIVGGIAEITEGMAYDGVKWESSNPDEADIFNQMATEQNLDALVRKMHRENFTYSQGVFAFWWDEGTFTVRGKSSGGNKRKKTYKVWYPKAITSLDVAKVVPVGMMQFGQERLAWQASDQEIAQYSAVLNGNLQDELMERFYAGQYVPTDPDEIQELSQIKVDISRLVLLNDVLVKRHTDTKQDFARFPDIRLRRVFRLLDMKQQLLEADRVMLIGAANYILLVKKGEKEDPAYPEEITNLRQNFGTVAKLPVVFSDHRLSIEIISPKQDFTLDPDKYDVLDNRISSTLLGLFGAMGSRSGNRGDNSLQEARLVARSLENRRHMARRFIERELARAVIEHPRNAGIFDDEPNLTFVPGHIQIDEDAGYAQAIISLRTMNELSRESTLEFFGFDQAVEAMRRTLEDESGMDDTFQTRVPFSASGEDGNGTDGAGGANGRSQPASKPASKAAPVAQGVNGARGGRPKGGGTPTRNPTKVGVSATGQQSTKGDKN